MPLAILLPVALTVLTLHWWGWRRRIRSLEALAAMRQLGPIEWELFDFPDEILDGLQNGRNPRNAFGGWAGKDFLLVFDIDDGWGKNTYRRTIVARRYDRPMPPNPRVRSGEMILFENGKWRALTPGRRPLLNPASMDAEAIDRAWNSLA